MNVLGSLAQILRQVPTAEMQTVSWESAYPTGPWLPPPLPQPLPEDPTQSLAQSRCLTLMGGPNLSQQEFISQGGRMSRKALFTAGQGSVLSILKSSPDTLWPGILALLWSHPAGGPLSPLQGFLDLSGPTAEF